MLRLTLLALALVATGCSNDEPTSEDRLADEIEDTARDTDPADIRGEGIAFSTDVDGDHVESILTKDGKVELGLTDLVLYSRLSKETQAEVTSEMESAGDQEGLGGDIARAISDAVAENIGTAVQVPVEDIRDIRFEDGQLVIEMVDGRASPFESVQTDGSPIFEQFAPADARRLAAAFEPARE